MTQSNERLNKFTEAYNMYYPLIFSTVYTKINDIDDVKDICQEIFIQCFNKFDEIENVRKWLYGAIRFEILNFYKKNRRENINIEDLISDISLSFVNGFRDVRIIIDEALENKDIFSDEQEKVLFDLIAIHNFSYNKTAAQLDLTERQVKYKYGLIARRFEDYLKSVKGIQSLEDLL